MFKHLEKEINEVFAALNDDPPEIRAAFCEGMTHILFDTDNIDFDEFKRLNDLISLKKKGAM